VNNPLEFFFSLGDKVTKGDQKKKIDFDYYMLWIIFIAFFTVFFGYIFAFYESISIGKADFGKLGWGIVILVILWFQYFTLKSSRDTRKYFKSIPPVPKFEKFEDVKEMINLPKEDNKG
jgi:hypothetical protein